MEGGGELDFARCSAIFFLIIIAALVTLSDLAAGQSSSARDSQIKTLFDQQRWADVIRQVEQSPDRDPDIDYFYGSALAQLGRWEDARHAFVEGLHMARQDKRFPIELGGVAFKQKRYRQAARWLHRGLRLDPTDGYVTDFLATIYFLQGNLEAALKYWNRVGKPEIQDVKVQPGLRIDPALLDRAFALAPATVLTSPDLLTSRARVDGLNVFPSYRFQLVAREDGNFDLGFRAHELDGFGPNKWVALLSAFRGLPYETVYAEYFNADRSAMNTLALIRWDDQKRRLAASFASPLRHNPKYRWQVGTDLRNELWDVRSSFNAPVLGHLNLQKEAVAGGITLFPNGRWSWSAGAEISNRQYRDVTGTVSSSELVPNAYQLKQIMQGAYELWRSPERRILLKTTASADTGRVWDDAGSLFEKLQAGAEFHWYPKMSGDDFLVQEQVRGGKTFGQVPFDELFMLGLERDNDLWLRAHIGTRAGRKGSAPLGRNYFLSSWNIEKNIYSNGLFGVKLSPFVDTGKITDPAGDLGSRQWLWDAGMQVKFSVLGVGVTFTYGKDLRTGNNAFYATTDDVGSAAGARKLLP